MTTLLRGVLVVSAAALAVGLGLHLGGWPIGDRLITGGLVTLVAIPVANTVGAVAEEVRRRR